MNPNVAKTGKPQSMTVKNTTVGGLNPGCTVGSARLDAPCSLPSGKAGRTGLSRPVKGAADNQRRIKERFAFGYALCLSQMLGSC